MMLMCSANASAYDIEVDGIYYNVDGIFAQVTRGTNKYSGKVKIPYTFVHGGETFYVTSIGDKDFEGFSVLNYLHITRGVESIGKDVFKGCVGLTDLIIDGINQLYFASANPFADCPISTLYVGRDCYRSNNGKQVRDGIFSDMKSLEELVVGATTPLLWEGAFSGCTSLEFVYCQNYIPCTLHEAAFDNAHYQNVILYVPPTSVPTYREADGWKKFRYITEYDSTPIEEIKAENPMANATPTAIYTLSGKKVSETQKGQIYIFRYGNGKTVKKLVK